MGVKKAGSAPLPNVDDPASIILPAGWRGPAFILYPNFKAVMNWNRSTLYALAIGILARQIAGGPPVMQAPPADDEPLVSRHRDRHADTGWPGSASTPTRSTACSVPRRARRCGCSRSRSGLPADGHPTPDVVRRLQEAAR